MQRLILLRHGEAQVRAASGRDIDRPLTPGGAEAARRTASALAAAGAIPDIALVSSSTRTRETWAAAQNSFPVSHHEIKSDLYNASSAAILKAARARAERTVMVIGHNPGMQGLALELLVEGEAGAATLSRVESRFPPATAAVFTFDADGTPELEALLMGGGA